MYALLHHQIYCACFVHQLYRGTKVSSGILYIQEHVICMGNIFGSLDGSYLDIEQQLTQFSKLTKYPVAVGTNRSKNWLKTSQTCRWQLWHCRQSSFQLTLFDTQEASYRISERCIVYWGILETLKGWYSQAFRRHNLGEARMFIEGRLHARIYRLNCSVSNLNPFIYGYQGRKN